jgi:hypothetical protein
VPNKRKGRGRGKNNIFKKNKAQLRLKQEKEGGQKSHSTSDSIKENFEHSPESVNNRIRLEKAVDSKLTKDLLAFSDFIS